MRTTTVETQALRAAVDAHRDEVYAILERYHASNPRIFGSVARGDAHESSDIDLLVDLAPGHGNRIMRLAGINEEISNLIGRPVDVVVAELLREPVSATALADAVAV